MMRRIVLVLIVVVLSVGLLLIFIQKSSNEAISEDAKRQDSKKSLKQDDLIRDTFNTQNDTVWLNVSAAKIYPVSFSIGGKLKKGDAPYISGSFVKEKDVLIALDMSNYFTEVSQLKLSLREELLRIIGSNPKFKEPDVFLKWNNFLKDIDISKKLPEFPAIYNLEEEQIVRNSLMGTLYVKCQQLEQNTNEFFQLNKYDGIIWEIKKKIGDEVKAKESVLSMVRKEDLIFSAINMNHVKLSKKNFVLFDAKGRKLGIVKILEGNGLQFKLDKIISKSILIDRKSKFYLLQNE